MKEDVAFREEEAMLREVKKGSAATLAVEMLVEDEV